jgi:hypothetical protein
MGIERWGQREGKREMGTERRGRDGNREMGIERWEQRDGNREMGRERQARTGKT